VYQIFLNTTANTVYLQFHYITYDYNLAVFFTAHCYASVEYAMILCLCVCVCVCVRVTVTRGTYQNGKLSSMQTMPQDSTRTRGFCCQRSPQNSTFRAIIHNHHNSGP